MKSAVGADAERLLYKAIEVLNANSRDRDADPQATLDQLSHLLSLALQNEPTGAETIPVSDDDAQTRPETWLRRNSVDDFTRSPQSNSVVEAEACQPILERRTSA